MLFVKKRLKLCYVYVVTDTGARPVVSIYTRGKSSTLEKKRFKMNTTWDCPFFDFTSNVQDALLRSLSRYDIKNVSWYVRLTCLCSVIMYLFFSDYWFMCYLPRLTQRTQTMLWSMVPHVTFKQRS